ncbi:sigma-70 family RNA polymerase sigma factor [Paenibacillus daejeonensis]|uniref:sigma-70 family RNA polymerase sigma factor n=1 Tax=Paenibacillus daejeonensis TaxID=135193 RepID=UPI0003764EEA|nr:sigma-70 family RNA polymerase sigma factor [Paenibacillus daejeonensis]
MADPIEEERIERWYREYQPLLTAVAYRMLGSHSEAEDAVQDVFVTLSRQTELEIEHPRAYLIKMVTNRALNMMKAAPRSREHYPGLWLPEPILDSVQDDGPQTQLLQRERLGYALLVLLQTCTPPERAVYVLRESVGCDYKEIAEMLGKTEAACRKIYSRAAAKLGVMTLSEDSTRLDNAMDRFVQAFTTAVNSGSFDGFLRLIAEDATLLSDGGGIVRSALRPILGRERIAAFFTGIARKGSLIGRLRPIRLSGQSGLLLERAGLLPMAFALEPVPDGSAIGAIYLISNPHKLGRATGTLPKWL